MMLTEMDTPVISGVMNESGVQWDEKNMRVLLKAGLPITIIQPNEDSIWKRVTDHN